MIKNTFYNKGIKWYLTNRPLVSNLESKRKTEYNKTILVDLMY